MTRQRSPEEELEQVRPIARASNLLGALTVTLHERLMEAMTAATGCSPPGIAALLCIHHGPGPRIEDLRVLLGLSHGATARVISPLEKAGLVERRPDPHDARAVALYCTEAGDRMALRALITRGRVLESLLALAPAVWLPRLIRTLEIFLENLAVQPKAAAAICRFCSWGECRLDVTAPCPVLLARSFPPDLLRGSPLGAPRAQVERRTIAAGDSEIELWLEPSGKMFRLRPGQRLEVECRGARCGQLEEERHPEGHIALYAWPGATFAVLNGDQEIFSDDERPQFRTLGRETVRQRVEALFGPFEARRTSIPRSWQ